MTDKKVDGRNLATLGSQSPLMKIPRSKRTNLFFVTLFFLQNFARPSFAFPQNKRFLRSWMGKKDFPDYIPSRELYRGHPDRTTVRREPMKVTVNVFPLTK